MPFLKNLFGKTPAPTASEPEEVVPVFIPPLVTLLEHHEAEKGAPLTEVEVLSIRDKAVCMTMRTSHAAEMAEKRGFPDISPDTVWADWQAHRA